MSERTIEIVREYSFDPKEVIAGLNGYYESDKRNGYITVRRNDVEGPAYLSTTIYLSALIEWLRVDHDIFYRPGLIFDQVEAARNAAKMCCLRAHIKDEISKRGLWCDKAADIPALVDTLFEAYDECSKARDRNRKDATKLSEVIRELRKEVNALKATTSKVRSRLNEKFCALGYEEDLEKLVDIALRGVEARDETINRLTRPWYDERKDIMDYIRHEASRNGFDLPEEIDGEPLTIKRVFHDLLELLRQYESKIRNAKQETRKAVNEQLKKDTDYVADTLCDILEALGISKSDTVHLDVAGLKTNAIQRAACIFREHELYQEQLGKAVANYQALSEENQKLKNSQKSDINKLIRDCCTKHGIIAPSRYLSDEACVEYLFSVIDQKDRSFAILQGLYRDIFKKQPDGLSAEDIANKILSKMLETEDLLHLNSVDNYKLKLKDYILHNIKEHGYRYNGLETKSIEDIVDWIITMATCNRSNIALRDIYTAIATPAERLRYNIDDCNGAIVDHMKDYILERFEGFNSNTEYCLKKMAELDGCQKDLKILEEQQKWLIQQNSELATKVSTKDDEINKKELEEAKKEAKQECYDYLWNALKKLSPECDALKIDRYEDLVDRIFFEMSLINDNCKRCQRKHTTEKLSYIRRTNKAEEEVKNLKEQLDKAAADYQALNDAKALSFACYSQRILQDLYRDIFRKQPDGLSVEDIANQILDRILSVNEWADCEIKNLRSQIERLKGLINAMNEEVKDM